MNLGCLHVLQSETRIVIQWIRKGTPLKMSYSISPALNKKMATMHLAATNPPPTLIIYLPNQPHPFHHNCPTPIWFNMDPHYFKLHTRSIVCEEIPQLYKNMPAPAGIDAPYLIPICMYINHPTNRASFRSVNWALDLWIKIRVELQTCESHFWMSCEVWTKLIPLQGHHRDMYVHKPNCQTAILATSYNLQGTLYLLHSLYVHLQILLKYVSV